MFAKAKRFVDLLLHLPAIDLLDGMRVRCTWRDMFDWVFTDLDLRNGVPDRFQHKDIFCRSAIWHKDQRILGRIFARKGAEIWAKEIPRCSVCQHYLTGQIIEVCNCLCNHSPF